MTCERCGGERAPRRLKYCDACAADARREAALRWSRENRIRTVPVEPFQRAFVRSPATRSDLARQLGWLDARGRPDTKRVNRSLGLGHEGQRSVQLRTALKLGDALGLAPVDYGG